MTWDLMILVDKSGWKIHGEDINLLWGSLVVHLRTLEFNTPLMIFTHEIWSVCSPG